MSIWVNQEAWAPDCQVDGIVSAAGEAKSLLEDTDGSLLPDILDGDNDDIWDVDDSEEDSTTNNGKPDWWCNKNPNKC